MGFGFNLFLIFILVPLTGILLIAWLLSRKLLIGKILGFIWLGIFGLILLVGIINWLTSKTELNKDDYYGEYVVNRDYFRGEQTDWQYNHFRFEITDADSIYFYVTDKQKTLKTYQGTIKTTDPKNYNSERLIIEMEQPTQHILTSNPTTYRNAWSFYLVFNSPKFHNLFFKKGKWKPID
ncbi:hypothetical protein P700755_002983 [Psychroflexus torquis ATCC 700755]|uniref:Uncharacterized protein n=1 Tax=Psychroflexus torquis (strain ATCC 700755 / CIP 106069 / ACAM 623) TaxID=313595 RepID=K4IW39_PSYTT|nr:hypothetical protein [Psychroflexus torquis]AFU69675.1 hypothetical protein P700755_002983 [Psychroflexus torquis ATCC 700755]